MKDRLTVRLPKDLARALRAAARKSQRKGSEIVRMALRFYLPVVPAPGTRPAERVRGLLGSLESGIPDLAENHRAYILEPLKNALKNAR